MTKIKRKVSAYRADFPKELPMIIGCGVDVVDLQRIRDLDDRYGLRFLRKVFTDSEITYCRAKVRSWQHFAGRFAVKEAVLKSLGTGIQTGIGWKDIEVMNDSLGAPSAILKGGAGKRAGDLGVKKIHISISHGETSAVAQAIAEG